MQGHLNRRAELGSKIIDRVLARGQISHGYLFTGNGLSVLKEKAISFARGILCEHGSCGSCETCRKVSLGVHPDLIFITPKGIKLLLENIHYLEREASYRPILAKRRVFIVDAAGGMTEEAANSLLKTLEEPPGPSVFILLSTNASSFLPTVLSRCQQISFVTDQVVDSYEGIEPFVEMVDKAIQRDRAGLMVSASKLEKLGREELSSILKLVLFTLRDAVLMQCSGNKKFRMLDTDSELYRIFMRLSETKLQQLSHIIWDKLSAVEQNANTALLIQSLAAHLWEVSTRADSSRSSI